MTSRDVIQKAIEKRITWTQAATICRLSPRHLSRLREQYEKLGLPGQHPRSPRQPDPLTP